MHAVVWPKRPGSPCNMTKQVLKLYGALFQPYPINLEASGGHSHICCSHGLDGLLTSRTKEVWSHYTFFCILSGQWKDVRIVRWLICEMQRSQTVKSLFAMRSRCQAARMTVKHLTNGQGRDSSIYGSDHPLQKGVCDAL